MSTPFAGYLRVASVSWGARAVAVLAQLAGTRLLVGHLGTDDYAAFAVFVSITTWAALADGGVSAAVLHGVADARARGAPAEPLLRASLPLLAALLVAGTIVAIAGGPPIAAMLLGRFRSAPPALLSTAGGIAVLGALAGAGYAALFAEGRNVKAVYGAAAAVLSLVTYAGLGALAPGTPRLVGAVLGATVPATVLAVLAFAQAYATVWRRRMAVERAAVCALARAAYPFGVLIVVSAAVLNVDYLVMSRTLPPADIVVYALVTRVFGAVQFAYGAVLVALWPHCTSALARGDVAGAGRVIRRGLRDALVLVVLGTLGFALARNIVLRLLAPDAGITVSVLTVGLYGAVLAIRAWSDAHAIALMSLGRIRVLWLTVGLQAPLGAAAQYGLSLRYGVDGIVLGLGLGFLVVAWVPGWWFRRLTRAGAVDPTHPHLLDSGA